MSVFARDDLTARLLRGIRDRRVRGSVAPYVVTDQDIAAHLAEVVREWDFGPLPTEEEISHSQAIVDMEGAMLRADHAERERDEAVRLLENLIDLDLRMRGPDRSVEILHQKRQAWAKARAFLARHKEAQARTCGAHTTLNDDPVVCSRPAGHKGSHYDGDNLRWEEAQDVCHCEDMPVHDSGICPQCGKLEAHR